MPGYDKALKAAMKFAQNSRVREEAIKVAGPIAAAAGRFGLRMAGTRLKQWSDRRNAIQHARDLGGQYSENVPVAGEIRQLVWHDGKAVYAYPPLSEEQLGAKSLAQRLELQNFPRHLMKDPPEEDGASNGSPRGGEGEDRTGSPRPETPPEAATGDDPADAHATKARATSGDVTGKSFGS